ncbi:MAG: ATP-binding cassette domain-containing protein [Labilithrix sp.]|nr:ATP-binding cassette domain-containing protein [Labilithrix sp.]
MSAPDRLAVRPSSPMLRVQGLHCAYASSRGRVDALRDVSFEVPRSARLAVVGGSGAGKSTLLRCLNLLVAPSRGSVQVGDRQLTSLDARELAIARRQIGMVFQHFALLHRRTARENVALPLELAGLPRAAIARRVEELLDRVRLRDEADAYPSELSGGQRQRVGIARALAHAPRLLLCDEPTSALDADNAQHVVALLDGLSRDLELTIVFVSHQLEVVRSLADVVAVLDGGALCELTPVAEFFSQPRSPAGARLLTPESPMKLPHDLVSEARRRPGVGPSTLLTFAISSNDATSVIFQTLSRQPSLRLDVVAANIESRGGQSVGSLSVLIHGEPPVIRAALASLEERAVTMEVVGHVVDAA